MLLPTLITVILAYIHLLIGVTLVAFQTSLLLLWLFLLPGLNTADRVSLYNRAQDQWDCSDLNHFLPSLMIWVQSLNPSGGRREPTPQRCPLTSTCKLWHVRVYATHIHKSKRNFQRKIIRKKNQGSANFSRRRLEYLDFANLEENFNLLQLLI